MEKPKTPLSRKISDPVQLKPGNEEFIRRWNGLDLSDQSDASSDELPKHPNVWVEIAHILRPILGACGRQCREKNKWKHVKTPCRRKSRAVDQDQLWPLESCRRAKSEAWLCGSNSVKVDCIAEYSPTDRRKKVCFGGADECKKVCERRRSPPQPRPILHRRESQIPTALEHMDYPTFKAWRRGSRLSEDVLGHPLKLEEQKENKLEQMFKTIISNCVVTSHHRPISDF